MSEYTGLWIGLGIAVAGYFFMNGMDIIETGLSKLADAIRDNKRK